MTHLTMVYKWHRQYIATKDELFRVRKQRDALLAACEARELVLEHYKHCAACMHNEQCDAGFDLGVNEHGLRQVALAKTRGE